MQASRGNSSDLVLSGMIISILASTTAGDAAGASIQLPQLSLESMAFLGNASFGRAGQIEINSPNLAPSSSTGTRSSGRALYNLPVQMLNPSASFETSFTFSTLLGSAFFFLMVPNNQELSTLHGFSLRFSTGNNTIAVWSSSHALATMISEFDLGQESRRTSVWLSYDSRRHRVEVRATNVSVSVPPSLPVIALGLDLGARVVNEFMYVGFAASSTLLAAKSSIYAWNFTSWIPSPSAHPDPAALDSSVDSSRSSRTRKSLAAAGIAVAALVISLAAAVVIIRTIRSKYSVKKFSRTNDRKLDRDDQSMLVLRAFSYKELCSATNGFDTRHKLGSQCYRGVLSDSMVAIKVVSGSGSSIILEKSLKLLVELASLRHRNLVNLLGWCSNRNSGTLEPQAFLVYEFIPNGSLDEHLFSSSNRSNPLPWSHRHKVACGLAQALEHLHSRGLAHGNVKSSNVMLDANFTARLGDYGVKNRSSDAKPVAGSMIVAGTFGYVAPEAVQTGRPTSRADVFAYGAVVLELVCGRRALETTQPESEQQLVKDGDDIDDGSDDASGATVLVDRVRRVLIQSRSSCESIELEKVVDEKLGGLYDVSEMEALVTIGLACSDSDPERRPSMEAVVKMLAGEAPLPRVLQSCSSRIKDHKMKAAAGIEGQGRSIEDLIAMKDFGSLLAAHDSEV